jgi:hypothetical protein
MYGSEGPDSAHDEYEPRGFPQTESFSNLWLQICLMQNGLCSLALGAIEVILVITKLQVNTQLININPFMPCMP